MKTGRKDSVISSSLLPHRVLSHLVMRVPCSLPHAVTLLSLFLFFFAPRLTPPSSISLSFSTHRSSLSLCVSSSRSLPNPRSLCLVPVCSPPFHLPSLHPVPSPCAPFTCVSAFCGLTLTSHTLLQAQSKGHCGVR